MPMRRVWAPVFLTAASYAAMAVSGPVQVTVVDGGGKPLPDAVVFLDSPEAKSAVRPQAGIEVEQVNKQFAPSVSVVPVGSLVAFPNRDTVRHHVYSFSPAKTFDLKLYTGTPTNPVLFDKTGVVVLGCNIHDQMLSWVLVVETPYFGKTGSNGQVNLSTAPPGNYRLKVWHAGLAVGAPAQEQAVTVGAAALAVRVVLKGVTP
jgi:plastocyanin